MLSLKQTKEGHYYIQLDGETIHGGLTKDEATSFMYTYHKIWEAGQEFGRMDVEEIDLLTTCGTFDTNDCISTDDLCKLLDKTDNWEKWITSQIKQEGVEKYLEWYVKMFERNAVCEELIEAHNKLFNNTGETK